MVISDRVAVLHRGRVEQVGPAEDLFRRPRTRFVAEFIGRANLVDVVTVEPGVAVRGALRLSLASRDTASAAAIVVSIRPHEIELVTLGRTPPAGANVLAGTVQRTSYLGDAIDYQVLVSGTDVVLRVTAPPPVRASPGVSVTLAIVPEACVPLTGGGDGGPTMRRRME
jgi:ABC-type Fe3+/spermidine/putrescine transport system ATPase subunit